MLVQGIGYFHSNIGTQIEILALAQADPSLCSHLGMNNNESSGLCLSICASVSTTHFAGLSNRKRNNFKNTLPAKQNTCAGGSSLFQV